MAEAEQGEAKSGDIISDDAFVSMQTLSFVSPHAFRDHARKVKGITDNHEERLLMLEARDDEGRLLAALTAMLEDKFSSIMKELQDQVHKSRNPTKVFHVSPERKTRDP